MDNDPNMYGDAGGGNGSEGNGQSGTKQVMDQARQKAGEVADQARGQLMTQLTQQKDKAATSLDELVVAIRKTSQSMTAIDQQTISRYVGNVAEQIEQASEYIRDHEVEDLVQDAADYARRQPLLFLGGTFALGFLVSRLIKNSLPEAPRPDYSREYAGGQNFASGSTVAYNDIDSSNNYSSGVGSGVDMATTDLGTTDVQVVGMGAAGSGTADMGRTTTDTADYGTGGTAGTGLTDGT